MRMVQIVLTMEILLAISTGLIIIIAMFVADRISRRVISGYSRRLRIEKHAENILKLTSESLSLQSA